MKRYHETIYLPNQLMLKGKELASKKHEFTEHAKSHFYDKNKSHRVDRKLVEAALINIEKRPPDPFEVYVNNGKVIKAVFKSSYNKTQDIIFVLSDKKVVTFYLNGKFDNHVTLNGELYEHGE